MPSIDTERDKHAKFCLTLGHPGDRDGDVRRCGHGKILINEGLLGVVGGHWVPLYFVFNPIKYRRAKKALDV